MPIFGLGMYLAESGDETVQAVNHAITKAGYIHLDSAQCYKNEEDVGKGMKESGVPRENIFVTTKLFTTKGGRRHAIETAENSLKAMNIGYIDQYLLHCPQGGNVLECYDVLLEYQKKGLIKTVGVSNFGVAHLEALKNSGRPLPQTNQIELHPWCLQTDICNWCKSNNVQVVGYSPLVQNKKHDDPLLVELAKKYNKSQAQILIRFSLEKGWVTIPKSTKPHRIEENSNVFDFELEPADLAKLNEVGRGKKGNVWWDPTNNDIATEFGPTQ